MGSAAPEGDEECATDGHDGEGVGELLAFGGHGDLARWARSRSCSGISTLASGSQRA